MREARPGVRSVAWFGITKVSELLEGHLGLSDAIQGPKPGKVAVVDVWQRSNGLQQLGWGRPEFLVPS